MTSPYLLKKEWRTNKELNSIPANYMFHAVDYREPFNWRVELEISMAVPLIRMY